MFKIFNSSLVTTNDLSRFRCRRKSNRGCSNRSLKFYDKYNTCLTKCSLWSLELRKLVRLLAFGGQFNLSDSIVKSGYMHCLPRKMTFTK